MYIGTKWKTKHISMHLSLSKTFFIFTHISQIIIIIRHWRFASNALQNIPPKATLQSKIANKLKDGKKTKPRLENLKKKTICVKLTNQICVKDTQLIANRFIYYQIIVNYNSVNKLNTKQEKKIGQAKHGKTFRRCCHAANGQKT